MHRAAHGRLCVQEMVDRLARRELVKDHCVWVSVHICNVLVVSVCMVPPSSFPDPLLLTSLFLLLPNLQCVIRLVGTMGVQW